MLTSAEVRSIPLFASISPSEAERVAGMAADIHLVAGEFAVPEGGERAPFAVIAGRIEVVKLVDGVERTLGWRLPGTSFGEVPLTLGTPFPGGYRAAEPSRVLRLDAQQYYSVIAQSPDVALRLTALARERIGGLQGIAAAAPKPRLTIFAERCDALFVFIGAETETTWLPPEIARDERGYVLTGHDVVKASRWSHHRDPYLLESSVPGVFACGDVRLSPVKRVASAVGEGSMAIAFVHQFLEHERDRRVAR